MATTKRALRQALARRMHDIYQSTTTAAGSTTTFVDSSLRMYQAGKKELSYVLATSGTYAGQVRRIANNGVDLTSDTTTATVTIDPPLAGAFGNAVTYDIYSMFHPLDYIAALNEARTFVYPPIHLPIVDETIILSNPLLNSDMETWTLATVPDNWTMSATNAAANTSIIFHGSKSCALTRAGTDIYMYQNTSNQELLKAARGQSVTFYMWGHSAVASQLRLSVNDGTTTTTGDYHAGNSEWELLDVTANIPTTATAVEVRVEVNGSNTVCYVDAGWLEGPWRIYVYTLPSSFVTGPDQILRQSIKDDGPETYTRPFITLQNWEYEVDSETRKIRFMDANPGYRLRLKGPGMLTALTEDTLTAVTVDTTESMELSQPQLEALLASARIQLIRKGKARARGEEAARWEQMERDAVQDEAILKGKVPTGPLTVPFTYPGWRRG